MYVATGNDEDSFVSVAGNYHKPLDGKMLPGATKYGGNEYSIEKKAIKQDFYIESSCGDPDYTGEVAYFGDKILDKALAPGQYQPSSTDTEYRCSALCLVRS
jgi:hypothetical protein